MTTVFNKFAKFILNHKDKSISELYNAFIHELSDQEKTFVSNNYMLMIKTGEAARNSDETIKKILQEV